MIIQNYTSCGCTPGTMSNGSVIPPSPCGTNCLYNPDLIVMCSDSIAPGQAGATDISTEHNGDTFCTGTLTYQLYSWDMEFFSAVTLTGNTLNYTLATTAPPGSYGHITTILSCDGDQLNSAQSLVQICAKNLCEGVVCIAGEVCDPLDGDCKPISDIEVS